MGRALPLDFGHLSIDIKAGIGDVFRSVRRRLGEGFATPQGESLQMILEQWPGGRWFRAIAGMASVTFGGTCRFLNLPCCWN